MFMHWICTFLWFDLLVIQLIVYIMQEWNFGRSQSSREADIRIAGETDIAGEAASTKDKGVYVGTEDDMQEESDELSDTNSDGLGDIWNEMTVALECSKVASLHFNSLILGDTVNVILC